MSPLAFHLRGGSLGHMTCPNQSRGVVSIQAWNVCKTLEVQVRYSFHSKVENPLRTIELQAAPFAVAVRYFLIHGTGKPFPSPRVWKHAVVQRSHSSVGGSGGPNPYGDQARSAWPCSDVMQEAELAGCGKWSKPSKWSKFHVVQSRAVHSEVTFPRQSTLLGNMLFAWIQFGVAMLQGGQKWPW